MPIIKLILLFTSSLLLAACDTKPIDTEASNQVSSGKRKRVELSDQTKEESFKVAKVDAALVSLPARQEEPSIQSNGMALAAIEGLPDEMMLHIFSHLLVPAIFQASQVCKYWHMLSEEPALWKVVRLHIQGDYLATEATKENAKKHILRVQVNTLTDCSRIELLVSKYILHNEHPFTSYRGMLGSLLGETKKEMLEEYASQGHEMAIWLKVDDLATGKRGCKQNIAPACLLNAYWLEQDDEPAIQREIEGLAYGDYRYEQDPTAAMKLNEKLIEQGNESAIERKIEGLIYGDYGYEQDPAAAIKLNEYWVSRGNEVAVERKVEGLAEGEYGYEKNLTAALQLNEQLAGQNNEAAIERKIYALGCGGYGYQKDPIAALKLNEYWIRQGNQIAIERKIEGLIQGEYGYAKDSIAAVILNEQLIEQGNVVAIERKLKGLTSATKVGCYGYGYIYGLEQFQHWLAEEEQKGTRWAYYLKAQALKYGILGYQQNRDAAIEYIIKHSIPY